MPHALAPPAAAHCTDSHCRAVFFDQDDTLVEGGAVPMAAAPVRFTPRSPGPLQALADAGWQLYTVTRTQAIALLETASRELGIDLAASWMIGDVLDDVEAGRRVGCRTLFVDRGNETEWRLSPWRIPHHSCGDLQQAATVILEAQAGER